MGLEFDFSSVISKFEELERKVQKDISTNALNKGADIMLKAQIDNAPEDTGELKSSLDKKNLKIGTNASIEVGINSGDEDVIRYGYYQEYGTESIVGNKWMKSAFNNSIKEASEAIKESIIKDLDL